MFPSGECLVCLQRRKILVWAAYPNFHSDGALESMGLSLEAFHAKKTEVFNLCKNAKDEAFHYLLYQVRTTERCTI